MNNNYLLVAAILILVSILNSAVVLGQNTSDPNMALQFDGIDDYVQVADNELLRSSQMTVEVWVRPVALSSWATILMKSSDNSWSDGFGLAHYSGTNDIHFFINNYGSTHVSGTIQLNAWTHVAGTYDGTKLRLYINGQPVDSTNYESGITHSTSPLFIGRGAGTGYYWNGSIDEVRLWNKALTANEIEENLNDRLVGSEPGLVGYWRLDEGTGIIANDASLNGNIGNLMNDPTWIVSTAPIYYQALYVTPFKIVFNNFSPGASKTDTVIVANKGENNLNVGPIYLSGLDATYFIVETSLFSLAPNESRILQITFLPDIIRQYAAMLNIESDDGDFQVELIGCTNKALKFDGTCNKVVNIPHSSSISFSDTSTFTIEVWFMPTQENSGYYHVLGKRGDAGHTYLNYQIAKDPPSLLSFISDAEPVSTLITPPLNAWTHMAVTYDGTLLRAYVNGKLEVTTPYTMQGETTVPLQIGNSGNLWCYFIGFIDEVRIWNIVRSSGEIAGYYNRIVSPKTPGLVGYWNFDEFQDDQVVLDSSPMKNNGTLGADLSIANDDPQRVDSTVPFLDSQHDAAVLSILAPDSVVVIQTTVTPRALIKNVGLTNDTIQVNFQIGSFYHGNAQTILDEGDSAIISFPDWNPEMLGAFSVLCYTSLPNDIYTGNDTVKSRVTVVSDSAGPAIFSVTPSSGGNLGMVSVTIHGRGFLSGASAKLSREGYQDIVATETLVIDSANVEASIDLTGRQLGNWNVAVNNMDGSKAVLDNGFIVEEGFINVWIEILGRIQVRAGRDFVYQLQCGNSGNVTARRVLVKVSVIGGLLDTPVMSAFEEKLLSFEENVLFFIVLDLEPTEVLSFPVHLHVGTPLYVDLQVECVDASALNLDDTEPEKTLNKVMQIKNPSEWSRKRLPAYPINLYAEPDPAMDGAYLVNSGIVSYTSHCGILIHRTDGWYVAENLTTPSQTKPSGFRLTPWGVYAERVKRDGDAVYGVNIPMDDIQRNNLKKWCLDEETNWRGEYDRLSWKCTDATSQAYREGAYVDFPWVDPLTTPAEIFLELTGKLPLDLFPPIVAIVGGCVLVMPNGPLWAELKTWLLTEILYRYVWPLFDTRSLHAEVTTSWDPNEKTGPVGCGVVNCIHREKRVDYFIFFENVDSATAAAQEIDILDTLDTNLNWSSFAFGDLQICDTIVTLDDSGQSFSMTIPWNDTTEVRISGNFSSSSGIVRWYLRGTDTRTGDLADFLPPNVNPPEGEGHVSFSIKPQSGLSTGTEIRNRASIVFDVNPSMLTNEVFNTIDAGTPTSYVQSFDDTSKTADFEISWTGEDDPGGSGVRNFSIYSAEDGGPYSPWLSQTSGSSAVLSAEGNHSYWFYSIAKDSVGNMEHQPAVPDLIIWNAGYSFTNQGWYLAAISNHPKSDSLHVLFADALGAFRWNPAIQSYVKVEALDTTCGYWLAIPSVADNFVAGPPLNEYTKHFSTGWHIIGAVAQQVDFTNPNDNPDGSVIGAFGWNPVSQQYFSTTTLLPNHGYWIAAIQECDLTVGKEISLAKSLTIENREAKMAAFYKNYGENPPPPPAFPGESETRLSIPETYELYQNYPNPFNAQTVIKYQLPEAGKVSLKIYNILGQEVKTLIDEDKPAGYYNVIWDGKNNQGSLVTTGLYIYRIKAGEFESRKKMLILK